MKQTNVTAIIPAFNEEETISQVVRTLLACPSISQVLVVSDGSTDRTALCAKDAGAVVYELPRKGGKGEALLYALRFTTSPVVAFFDADLRGLTPDHVTHLVQPVLDGSLVMSIALRDRGPLITRLNAYLPLIAGERVLLRHVIDQIPPTYLKGYMIEASLNYFCRSHRLAYGAMKLPGLRIRTKYEKVGFGRAVLQYIHMTYQVVKAMILVRLAHWQGNF